MSDEKEGKDAPAADVAATPEASGGECAGGLGVPLATYVRGGGTSTTDYDNLMAWEDQDAEARRDVAAAERALAQFPVEEGGAKLYTHRFMDAGEAALPRAYVLLRYVDHKLEPIYRNGQAVECLADIVVPDDQVFDGEYVLLLVCPRCYEQRPLQRCIVTIRQSNRRWHLDERRKGELVMFEGAPYHSAGQIMESERCKCSTCGWEFRVDRNLVRSENWY